VDWAEIVPSELDRFHERGRSDTAHFLTAPTNQFLRRIRLMFL
jgi:hypothetical protein